MDPDKGLQHIRDAIEGYRHSTTPDAQLDVADLLVGVVEGLDKWLTGGGYLPADWTPEIGNTGKEASVTLIK